MFINEIILELVGTLIQTRYNTHIREMIIFRCTMQHFSQMSTAELLGVIDS